MTAAKAALPWMSGSTTAVMLRSTVTRVRTLCIHDVRPAVRVEPIRLINVDPCMTAHSLLPYVELINEGPPLTLNSSGSYAQIDQCQPCAKMSLHTVFCRTHPS